MDMVRLLSILIVLLAAPASRVREDIAQRTADESDAVKSHLEHHEEPPKLPICNGEAR